MTDLTPFYDQVRTFAGEQLPAQLLEQTVLVAVAFLVAGIGLSVLGAKLARPVLATAVGALGGLAGWNAAGGADFHPLIGGAIGAAMFVVIAHLTFRIWVGLLAAFVFSTVALGAFGYQRVVPHIPEFDAMVMGSHASAGGFAIPSPAEQQAYRDRTPQEWARELWSFAVSRDAGMAGDGRLVGAAAAALGLFLGVIAVRAMLILSTSLVGTALIASGVATLIARCLPGSYQSLLGHPGVAGMGVGAFIVTSLVLQTLLTRKAPESKSAAGK